MQWQLPRLANDRPKNKASVCGDRKTSFSFWQKRKIGFHIYREFRSVGRDSYFGAQYR